MPGFLALYEAQLQSGSLAAGAGVARSACGQKYSVYFNPLAALGSQA
jgi:hypothetical protein